MVSYFPNLALTSVPYKRKKVRSFFGIFALNFREFRRFLSCQKSAFCLSPKTVDSCGSRCIAFVCRMKSVENLQNSNEGPFFFEIILKPVKKMRKFFSTDRECLKGCGIFTLSSECLHYFWHFRRR